MSIRIAPLIILGIIHCISLGIAMEKHGKPRKEKHNAWIAFFGLILQWGLILWTIL